MKIVKDALNELVWVDCKRELQDKLRDEVWSSSTINWSEEVKLELGTTLATKLSPELSTRVLDCIKEHLPKCEYYQLRFYIWQPLTGIPPHTDKAHKFGATIYLNEKWDRTDGGWFLWKEGDDEIWKAIPPQRNLMMINHSNEWHCVPPVSPNPKNMRYTIQIWGDN